MIVPAKRALTWQLTDANNKGIVRERLWLSTRPGEIRTCTSCHGESSLNQAGQTSPTNAPQALTTLLNHVKTIDSDNDGVKDIYDAFPNDPTKNIAEPVNEKFVVNLANWINQNLDNDAVSWTTQSNTCNANSAMINNRAADNTGKIDRLRRFVDLSNMDFAKLSFDVAYARYDASKFDRLKVYAISCDGTQHIIYDKAGSALATAPDQTTLFTPADCNQWRNEVIDLSAYVGKTVELVFEDVGGWGNRLFLDNILIQEIDISPPCPNTQTFSGNLSAGKYNAATSITTQNGVQTRVFSGTNVTFNGGSSVTLQAGFEAQSGSVFKAYIGGCGY
jgi:hypothetical protein